MKDREIDVYIAKHMGYTVAPLQGTALYMLHKPHRRLTNGLGSVQGSGPQHKVPGKPGRALAFTADEAWEWVPHFSTNDKHAEELRMHLMLICDWILPAYCINAQKIANYCYDQFQKEE